MIETPYICDFFFLYILIIIQNITQFRITNTYDARLIFMV